MINAGRTVLFIVLAALGLIAFWAIKSHYTKPVPPPLRETVRFAASQALISAPVVLAQGKGYFDAEGLDVDFMGHYSSGKTAFEAMLRGEADVSVVATTPVVVNSFSRDDFFIFVTYTTSYEGVKIIGRRDMGVSSASDLKGKTIGIVPGTISQLFLDSVLAYNRILPGEVTMKEVKPEAIPELLKSGVIQAGSVWEPHAYNAQQVNKDTSVKIPSFDVYRIAVCLAATRDFAQKHPGVLIKMVKALDKATTHMRENTEQAQADLVKLLHTDKETLVRLWEEVDFELSLDQVLLMTMDNEAIWLMEHHFTNQQKIPDYTHFVYCAPLEAVKPRAVTIVRETYTPQG
ncbi:MAG: ABC transporter substrate-binding protein [Desulfatibacillum sp.]|nr:ABC transporter substrate-binding protein [Desulfatibacillum sp.]